MDTKAPVVKSYGLYIRMTSDIIEKMRELKAAEHMDVVVEIDGAAREFTFDEFLKKLGFKE